VRFVLHHTHTQVETRDNHPLPDSPPSISSHREGDRQKKKKNKNKNNKLLNLFLSSIYAAIVFQSYWLQCFHRQHCLSYIKLSHTHKKMSFLFCFSLLFLPFPFCCFVLFLSSLPSADKSTPPPLID
jgi:hypothetical protein